MAAAWQVSGSDSPHRESASEAAFLSAWTGLQAVVLSRTADVNISAITGESSHHPNVSRQLDHGSLLLSVSDLPPGLPFAWLGLKPTSCPVAALAAPAAGLAA
jgi:hypothetical protein